MKNKKLVLDRVEQIRQSVRNINYLLRTNGSFDELNEAFEKTNELLESMENLVTLEEDPFRTNQII